MPVEYRIYRVEAGKEIFYEMKSHGGTVWSGNGSLEMCAKVLQVRIKRKEATLESNLACGEFLQEHFFFSVDFHPYHIIEYYFWRAPRRCFPLTEEEISQFWKAFQDGV
ncbi:MAG TPA: hypothetical protein VFM02_00765 [Candidatus Paceibacterota bacterium]|nr:hypothetical protein [Candidatus Paceibacterota bacterium]